MTIAERVPLAVDDEEIEYVKYVQWGPIVAGALAAATLAFVLHTFAAAMGLAVSSTSPTWRDSSFALQLLSGLYLVLVAVAAFGVGGYLAGRLRSPRMAAKDEIEFRDSRSDGMGHCHDPDRAVGLGGGTVGNPPGGARGKSDGCNPVGEWREPHRLRSRPAVSRRAPASECRSELRPRRGRAHRADQRRPQRTDERRPDLSGPPRRRYHRTAAPRRREAGGHDRWRSAREHP